MITIEHISRTADKLMVSVPEGDPLDTISAALIEFGVVASVTALDSARIESSLDAALAAGATIAQIEEVIALVSGLGVHSLMMTMAALQARSGDHAPLDAERQALWAHHVGDDPYWAGFESEFPGFLDAMLRLSPATFEGFFSYCAIPWANNHVRARTKELVALACDASPSHRFMPGFRLHLANALKLGIGKRAIREALAIAARSPVHQGVG